MQTKQDCICAKQVVLAADGNPSQSPKEGLRQPHLASFRELPARLQIKVAGAAWAGQGGRCTQQLCKWQGGSTVGTEALPIVCFVCQ